MVPRSVVVDAACIERSDQLRPALGRYRWAVVDTGAELRKRACGALGDAAVILLAPRPRDASFAPRLIRPIAAELPCATMYIVDPLERPRHLRAAWARAGADAAFASDRPGWVRGVQDAIDARLAAPVPCEELIPIARSIRPSEGRAIAMHCLRTGYLLDGVRVVAEWFGVSPATVNRRLRAQRLPSPVSLLRYGALLCALELAARYDVSRWEIARRIGRDSAPGLRELRLRHERARRRDPRLAALVRTVESARIPEDYSI